MKKLIWNLLARLFARKKRENTTDQVISAQPSQEDIISGEEKTSDEEFTPDEEETSDEDLREKRAIMFDRWLCHAIRFRKYYEVKDYFSQYQENFGKLFIGYYEEEPDVFYLSAASNDDTVMLTDDIMSEFLEELVDGKNPDVDAYVDRWNRQYALLEAVKSGDILKVDELLKQGADINYVYYFYQEGYIQEYAEGICSIVSDSIKCCETLWDCVPKDENNRMFRYFLGRNDCHEAMAFKKRDEAEKELLKSMNA